MQISVIPRRKSILDIRIFFEEIRSWFFLSLPLSSIFGKCLGVQGTEQDAWIESYHGNSTIEDIDL